VFDKKVLRSTARSYDINTIAEKFAVLYESLIEGRGSMRK
jgi:hypothetical protein